LKRIADENNNVECPDKRNERYKLTQKYKSAMMKFIVNGEELNLARAHENMKQHE